MIQEEVNRQYHEVANIFPLMRVDEFQALKDDIAEHGQREPIWLHTDGRIIDGRNRHRACSELGVEPEFQVWDGKGSLIAFVVSLNLIRRHLDESQRAMVAARLATMAEGRPDKTASIEAVSQEKAADLLNVSRSAVQRAHIVQERGSPELAVAVDSGEVAVSGV
jgi:ParB-like chromosome segregation protein Spo0J